MYRLKLITILIFIISLSVLFFVNCGDDNGNGPAEHELVGTWELTKITIIVSEVTTTLTPELADMYMTLVVNADNTFSMTQTQEGVTETDTGTWDPSESKAVFTVEGETIIVDYTVTGNKVTLSYWQEGQNVILEFTKQ